jgi:ABC-type branched-subunit amino acid transport system substrate-binding protein
VRLWAEASGVRLALVDDGGSTEAALHAYSGWIGTADLLIGPYASGLVRAVAPLVREAGRVLWNHGGSADDLAQPGVACLPAPASSYFDGVVKEAARLGIGRLAVVQGQGRFARAVANGVRVRASEHGMDVETIDSLAVEAADVAGTALLVAGSFEHDIAVIRSLHRRGPSPALLGAVAAGIPAFGEEVGELAEGVLGPVQWWPSTDTPEVGPAGIDFFVRFQRRTGRRPSYPAAQAAAAGYLAHAAHGLGLALDDVPNWTTSSLLGRFALDASWRQTGHHVTTVRWQGGRMVPVDR